MSQNQEIRDNSGEKKEAELKEVVKKNGDEEEENQKLVLSERDKLCKEFWKERRQKKKESRKEKGLPRNRSFFLLFEESFFVLF